MAKKKTCYTCEYYFEKMGPNPYGIEVCVQRFCQALPVVQEIYRVKPCIYYKAKEKRND